MRRQCKKCYYITGWQKLLNVYIESLMSNAPMKANSLWVIVSGIKPLPDEVHVDPCRKLMTRSDHTLAIIVLALEPLLATLLTRRFMSSLAKARRTISAQNSIKQAATTEKTL